jgi:hypothetical protein
MPESLRLPLEIDADKKKTEHLEKQLRMIQSTDQPEFLYQNE